MSTAGTSTTDLLDQAMCNEGMNFISRIQKLEGDELFTFARYLAEVKLPSHLRYTSIGDVFHAAGNMTALADAQELIYSFGREG
jgi:hypothetical protein